MPFENVTQLSLEATTSALPYADIGRVTMTVTSPDGSISTVDDPSNPERVFYNEEDEAQVRHIVRVESVTAAGARWVVREGYDQAASPEDTSPTHASSTSYYEIPSTTRPRFPVPKGRYRFDIAYGPGPILSGLLAWAVRVRILGGSPEGVVAPIKTFPVSAGQHIQYVLNVGKGPVDYARELLGAPYLFGGKGYDYKNGAIAGDSAEGRIGPAHIKAGYDYVQRTRQPDGSWRYPIAHGLGIDCSGLVRWSYNGAFGEAAVSLANEGADAQYQNVFRTTVSEAELEPGDVLVYDGPRLGFGVIDHIAMYAGPDANGVKQVIQARGAGVHMLTLDQAVGRAPLADGTTEPYFKTFRRHADEAIALEIASHSPVSLVVTDPDGITIDPDTVLESDQEHLNEVPGQLYYSRPSDENGDLDDAVSAPTLKPGDYTIRVVPKPGAVATDTFGLDFTTKDGTLVLADDVAISDRPAEGYRVAVDESGVPEVVPTDSIAPTVRATVSPAANSAGWSNSPVAVALRADDQPAGSGVESITYSATGAQPIATTTVSGDTAELQVRTEGTTDLAFTATDAARNTSDQQTMALRIDTTRPSASIDPGVLPHLLVPLRGRIRGRATDNLSGVKQTRVTFEDLHGRRTVVDGVCDAGCGSKSLTWSASLNGLRAGIYRVTASATDAASNAGPQSPIALAVILGVP